MTKRDDTGREPIPALGQPKSAPDPDVDPDFAREHEETAVDTDVITGEDTEREPESPRGWAGMQR